MNGIENSFQLSDYHGRNHHLLTFTISEFDSNIVNLEHENFRNLIPI